MPTLVELIKERFPDLTKVQKQAMPHVLRGENVLILAPTGTGKCVAGDTIIFTREGPAKIEDFYQRAISVNSLNPKLKIRFSKGAVIRKRQSKLFKVVTESGREVKVTDDHRFFVLKDGALRWNMLKDIRKGDFISCARKLVINDPQDPHITLDTLARWSKEICVKTSPNVSKLIKIIKKKKGHFGLRKIAPLVGVHRVTLMHAKKNHNMQIDTYLKLAKLSNYDLKKIKVTEIGGPACKTIRVPEINEDFAYFVGLFAGDGNFNQKNTVRFSTSSPNLLAFFKNFCNRLGLKTRKDMSRKYDFYVCNKALYVILNSLGFEDKEKSAKIRIPRIFFRKLSLVSAFLRGLFDTDGSVTRGIEYCTKSKEMAKQVQLALLCFGILSRLKVKNHKKYGLYHRILIEDSENICKFVSSIGFSHPKKMSKARKFFTKVRNPNKDIIPNIAACIKACKEKLGVSYQGLRANRFVEAYMYGRRNPSRQGLKRTLDYFSHFGKTEESSFLRMLATSDIFWDKIVEIVYAGKEYVYDATVPGNSNFIGNGIILHNTEAALLPVLEKLEGKKEGICALYITPLRSLGRDMLTRFNWWCDRLDISHDIRHGDSSQSQRAKHRKKPPQIMIITVETLQALLLGKILCKHLTHVKHVIVDEVHDILDNKRGAQLSLVLERLEELAGNFQRIALSATVANPHEAAKLIFGQRPHSVVEVGRGRRMDIDVGYLEKQETRWPYLKKQLGKKTLLFVNTRSTAEDIGARLRKMGADIEIYHGSLSKEVRITAEEKFKNGKTNALLATSSMELGLDIGDVEQVIQYGSPHQVFRLVQRIGRSGHSLNTIPKGIVIATDLDDRYEADVLSTFARQGWLEPKSVEQGASDVIAHQLIGFCLGKGKVDLKQIHHILQRAGAYGISFHQLKRIALQLYGEGLIFYDEDSDVTIKARHGAREYYYGHLSTIPKEKRFAMRNVLSNRILASLDERFVVNLETGLSFLAKGTAWKVIEIDEEVLVEPSEATEILVPAWVGEGIPVAYEIAQNAAKLRSRHKEAPDPNTVTMELIDELLVIHMPFGNKVNEGIGRILAYRLSQLMGEPCQMVSDPYRIMLRLPYHLDEQHILAQWKKLGDVRSGLEQSLQRSALLRFKFIHVARLFGLLEEDATVGMRFIDAMKNSIVYQETLRGIFFRYFDIEKTQEVLDKIRKDEIKITIEKREKLSKFARIGLDRLMGREAVGVFEPRKQLIAAFKEKLFSKMLELECLGCKATRLIWLANAPRQIACHKCKEKNMTMKNSKEPEYARNLIRNYGQRALLALASYGIGASTAERILRKLHPNEESFYWDLIEAQKTFIKNKKYWKLTE